MSDVECVLGSREYGWLGLVRRGVPSLPVKLAMAGGMAVVTGLLAQVRIVLPFTPVPITGQVFCVLLAGAMLGRSLGALSMGLYVGLGVAGVPWLAGGTAGFPLASGGYLLGFIPAALLVGWATERFPAARRYVPMVGVMAAAAGIIYLLGAVQLAAVMGLGAAQAVRLGVLPFIPGEIVKIVVAAGIASSAMQAGRR